MKQQFLWLNAVRMIIVGQSSNTKLALKLYVHNYSIDPCGFSITVKQFEQEQPIFLVLYASKLCYISIKIKKAVILITERVSLLYIIICIAALELINDIAVLQCR